MSSITDVVVYVPNMVIDDDPAENDPAEVRLDAYLTTPPREVDGDTQRFARLDVNAAGGHKVFAGTIYAAAFNYVGPDSVRPFLEAAPWGETTPVAVIAYEQDYCPIVWQPAKEER